MTNDDTDRSDDLGLSPNELRDGADVELALARQRMQQRLFAQTHESISIGRYVVLSRIGAGGMGIVYAAYDPQLDRRVALKLLPPSILASDAARRRFEREARSLAKIADPNVVAVHDVGEVPRAVLSEGEGNVMYIAMELVAGAPFGEWVAAERSWREILDAARQAARGLAAVHAAGLVHRDVKPDNVMVGLDGRVRVMDLGLARTDELSGSGDAHVIASLPDDSADKSITVPGALVGTPAYMAPEQVLGGVIDPRTDQFSFCVMLWEAFYGQRPFQGRSLVELSEAIATTTFAASARANPRRVPDWISSVLLRGLANDPAERWPDMHALLLALERDPTRTRRRRIAIASAVAVLGVGVGLWQIDRRARADACERDGARAAETWASASPAVRDAVLATTRPWKEGTWTRLDAAMQAWAVTWSSARTEACMTDTPDDVKTCLDLQLGRFDALAQTFAGVTTATLEHLMPAAEKLPRLERCANPTWMAAIVEEQPVLDRVAEVRARIARADAQGQTGAVEQARTEALAALEAARELDVAPVLAEALASAGQWTRIAGDPAQAEALFTEAYSTAGKAGYDDLALNAAVLLVPLVGIEAGRPHDGYAWARQAEMFAGRLGVEEEELGAALLLARGQLASNQGDYTAAQAALEHSLAIRERVHGPSSLGVADTLQSLGYLLEARNDYAGALAALQRALAIHREVLGPDHPAVARTTLGLTNAYWGAGDLDTAMTTARTALDVAERAVGTEHAMYGSFLMTVGALHMNRGELDEAEPYLVRAVDAYSGTRGPLHASTGNALFNLAELYRRTSRWLLADMAYRRAQLAFRTSLPPEHPNLAIIERGLGQVAAHHGDFGVAIAHHRAALASFEKAHGPAHLEVGKELVALSHALRSFGSLREAKEAAQRAVAVMEGLQGEQEGELAYAIEAVAEAHLAEGDAASAEPLLRRALALLEADLGEQSIELEIVLSSLARVEQAAGRTEAALAHRRRALAVIERELGPNAPRAVRHWLGLGETLLEGRRFAEAREAFERADRIAQRDPDAIATGTRADLQVALTRSSAAH